MFKFANKKKITGLFAALIGFVAVVGASVSSAFAYKPSYDEYRTGSNNYGVFQRLGDTPLTVKNAKLIYNISDFPNVGDSSDINYRSTLTMQYTLSNPADEAVTAQLLVPEIDKPNYFFDNAEVVPKVTVNGEQVELAKRYASAYMYDSYKAIDLSDELRSDAFFTPDLPVHMYKVTSETATYAQLRGDLITDLTKARYISNGYDEFVCEYYNDGASCFYILGDNSAVDFSALSFYNYNRYNIEKIDDKFNIELAETITLGEFIANEIGGSEGIYFVDYYNAILSRFSNTECVCCVSDLSVHNLQKLYAYTVEIPVGGEITTTVTVPVYPDVHSSDRCYYYFSTNSKTSFGAFGKFEVEIVTGKYIYNYTNDFKKTDTGYKATYSVAPDGVNFSLSTQNNGTYNYVEGPVENTPVETALTVVLVIFLVMIIALPVFGGGISFIVLMVKKSKQG